MNYQLVYNESGEVTGVYIDSVFYKVVGVITNQDRQTVTQSAPNARVTSDDPYSWDWLLENDGLNYTLKNAPKEPVKTQTQSSFWEGLTAEKLLTGLINGAVSIFGGKSQTQTVDPSVYGTNPYLVPQSSNNNNYLLLGVAAVVIVFLVKGNSDKKKP